MYNKQEYVYTNLTTGSTSQIFSGKGILHAINVNQSTSTIIALYDGIGTTTTAIGSLKASIGEGHYEFDVVVANGLYITYATGGDYTVIYTK